MFSYLWHARYRANFDAKTAKKRQERDELSKKNFGTEKSNGSVEATASV
jgi:hypothetical protein